jgi:perosamine synthetase
MSAESIKALITPQTRAILPVDLYGGMPDMQELLRIAEASGIALIEDAAEAIGAWYRGRPAGAFGVASVFSFHGSKTLTTGEGGMLVTDDDALFERAQVLRDHGRVPGDVSFFNREVAHKYKMSAMQAALGLAQLERLDELVRRKRQIFSWYQARLGALEGLILNAEPPEISNAYWMVTVIPDRRWRVGKRELIDRLRDRGVEARPFFYPLSSLPAYASRPRAVGAARRNPVAYCLSATGVNLPSALNLTEDQVDTVCRALVESLG